jgi:hypothetical protein
MLMLKVTEQLYAGFSVPIFLSDMPNMEEMNEKISGFLLNERLKDNAENSDDWATGSDLHMKGNPEVDGVAAMFANAIAFITRQEREMDIPPSDMQISFDVRGHLTRVGTVRSMLNYYPLQWRGIYFVRAGAKTTIQISPPYPPSFTKGTGKYRGGTGVITLAAATSTAILFPAHLTHSIIAAPGDGLNITVEIGSSVFLSDSENKEGAS